MTEATRRLTRDPIAIVAMLAIALMAVSSAALIFRPHSVIFNRPLEEDGYYVLNVARQIALGHGVTFDGQTLTNGFQPLWVFLCAPLFWLVDGDREGGMRLVLALHWVLYLAAGFLAGKLAARVLQPRDGIATPVIGVLASAIYLSATLNWMNSFNGLETSLVMAVLLGAFLVYISTDRVSFLGQAICGACFGVLVLARIDMAYLVVILAAAQLLRPGPLYRRFADAALFSGMAFLVSLPWWLYNVIAFHALMPSSGRALSDWAPSLTRYWVSLVALSRNLAPHTYISGAENTLTGLLRIAVLAAFAFLFRAHLVEACRSMPARARELLLCFVIFLAALTVWYPTASWAAFFYGRYLAGAVVIAVLFWTIVAIDILARVPRVARFALLFLALQIPLFAWFSVTGILFKGHTMLTEQVPLVAENVPPDEWVGAGQSGTLSFMRDRVINLDGRVNAEALPRQKDMANYLKEKNIRWIADWDSYVKAYVGDDPAQAGWRKVATRGITNLYHYEGP